MSSPSNSTNPGLRRLLTALVFLAAAVAGSATWSVNAAHPVAAVALGIVAAVATGKLIYDIIGIARPKED